MRVPCWDEAPGGAPRDLHPPAAPRGKRKQAPHFPDGDARRRGKTMAKAKQPGKAGVRAQTQTRRRLASGLRGLGAEPWEGGRVERTPGGQGGAGAVGEPRRQEEESRK